MRNLLTRSPSSYSFHALKILAASAAIAVIVVSILSMLTLSILRFMVNIYCIGLSGLFLVSEFYPLAIFSYFSLIYTPLGRCILFLLLGSICITSNLLDILVGSYVIIVGIIQYLACSKLGGVPKPFFNQNSDILLSNNNIIFADIPQNSNPIAPVTI